jgi:uncharacterized protein (TIGR03067 family)
MSFKLLAGSVLVFTAFGPLEGRAYAPRDQEEFETFEESSGLLLGRLQGQWFYMSEAVSGVFGGGEVRDHSILFKGERADFLLLGTVVATAAVRVGASGEFLEIDCTYEKGPKAGRTSKGIYEVEGNNLTICLSPPGEDRPTKFVSKKGSGRLLLVLKRQKP